MYHVFTSDFEQTVKQSYTITTRLSKNDSPELFAYFDEYRVLFNAMFRDVWYSYINGQTDKSKLRKYLNNKYDVVDRTSNSVVSAVIGRYNSIKELKNYEQKQLKFVISELETKIQELSNELESLGKLVADNRASEPELARYRKNKQTIHYKREKLNKKQQQYHKLEQSIKTGRFEICFGSKKIFNEQFNLNANGLKSHTGWYNKFAAKRDSSMWWLGNKNEVAENQLFQFSINASGTFDIKVRKHDSNLKGADRYVAGMCDFKYGKEHILNTLENKGSAPLNYRVLFDGTKLYLQCVITIKREPDECLTTNQYGTIGLDFNDGFISLAETNEHGNLVKIDEYRFEHTGKNAKKALNEMRTAVASIIAHARNTGKDISIENLRFDTKKAKQTKAKSEQGKRYNKMLSSLAYSQYTQLLTNACIREQVGLRKVNPAYTSQIGIKKYGCRSLNRHQGASLVIARKGQGLKDVLPK